MTVAVWLETTEDGVRRASLSALGAARELAGPDGEVIGVVCGHHLAAAAADAARHVARVLAFDDPALAAPLAETWAPILARAVRAANATALVATATSTGKDVLPRAAALLDAGLASDVVAVLGPRRFRRPAHAGNALAEIEVVTPVAALTVRQSAFAAAAPRAAAGRVEPQTVGPVDALGATFVGVKATARTRPDLGDAAVVISGGRGMKSAENFRVLEELADLLGGAVGASRAACDAGMVPNDLQVGQTGRVVAPKLYVAVAISGAIQHIAGMKGSKVIVAINKDPEAPIFQVADYGLVATWENALPELIARLRARHAGAGT